MSRIPRKFTAQPNFCVHKVWRGHNREWILKDKKDKLLYLAFLNRDLQSDKYPLGAQLMAFTLMNNHCHELFLIVNQQNFSNHMRRHHSRFGAAYNKHMNRCGKVAQDRPKTTLISDDHYAMRATFYIHANPIRAGIVKDARNYHWSTHRLYAFGKREFWMRSIQFPDWYLKLGKSMSERQRKYRQLFARYNKNITFSKQPLLTKSFLGPIVWTMEQEKLVKEWKAKQQPP